MCMTPGRHLMCRCLPQGDGQEVYAGLPGWRAAHPRRHAGSRQPLGRPLPVQALGPRPSQV